MMDREQLIRDRAYAIWQAEGQPEGCEQEHWERAAREIDEQAGDTAPADDAAPSDTAQATPADPVGVAQSPAPAAAPAKRTAQRKTTQSAAGSPKRKAAKTPA